jgi:hypothetical protein
MKSAILENTLEEHPEFERAQPNLGIFEGLVDLIKSREGFDDPKTVKETIIYQMYLLAQDSFGLEFDNTKESDFAESTELFLIETQKLAAEILPLLLKIISSITISDFIEKYNRVKKVTLMHQKGMDVLNNFYKEFSDKQYTVKEAMGILAYAHKQAIYHHIKKGNLRIEKLSERKTVIYEYDLATFIKKQYNIEFEDYLNLDDEEKKLLHKH